MNKIDASKIQAGSRFNANVYFDDGVNMFLSAEKPAKRYHLDCIKRWKLDFFLTDGKELEPEVKAQPVQNALCENSNEEELEELAELEELEEI